MTVIHKIKMDLTNCTVAPCVDVMQDDRYSRDLEVSLFAGLAEFSLPEDCRVLIRYRKPDGKGGIYDTMPDGTQAWRIGGNQVTVSLAPQVCTAAGDVALTVTLVSGETQLSCFEIRLRVRRNPQGNYESRNYFSVTGFLPQTRNAAPGQYLRVTEVDSSGRVTGLESVELEYTRQEMAGGGLVINLTGGNGAYQADRTPGDILEAWEARQYVCCNYEGRMIPLNFKYSDSDWVFSGVVMDGEYKLYVVLISEGVAYMMTETLVLQKDLPTVPASLPNPYSLVFTGAVNTTYNGAKRVTVEIPSPGAEGIPDYVTEEAKRVASVVQGHQNANTVTFLTCSDLHYSESVSNAAQQKQTLTHCGQAMGLLRDMLHIDFAAMLGDTVWDSGETPEMALSAMRTVNSHLAKGFSGVPNFRARGNHDCLYSDPTGLSDAQIFTNVGAFNTGAEFDGENRMGGYCCRDFQDRKLRVICINTSESSSGEFNVSAAQLSWLQRVLDLSGLGEGWQSIVLGHHPPDWTGSGNDLVQTLKAAEGLLCVFHGHVHGFKTAVIPNTSLIRIAIPNACFGRENEYGKNGVAENSEGTEFGETVTYQKQASKAADTSFCVVTLDPVGKKVYSDHYGAGYDRIASVGEAAAHSVSYQLTKVTSSNVASTAAAGAGYTAQLKLVDGYAFSNISVTMGGQDITASAFRGGRVTIGSVTGDVVISAQAAALSGGFADRVPTSLDSDGSGVFNGTGYRDDCYISTEAPYWKSATDGSVSTGLMPYRVYGEDNTTYYQPPAIYIRGAEFSASDSRNRLGLFTADRVCVTCPYGETLLNYFDLEILGLLYYRLTPKMNAGGQNLMAAAGFSPTVYLALTANGLGENLTVTLDEPIN